MERQFYAATQQSLPPAQQQQLLAWYLAANQYEIQAVYLLSVAQPHQLAEIMRSRRLSRCIHKQLSPRHAIVAPSLIQLLQKWLLKKNKYLHAPQPANDELRNEWSPSATHWLGLKLLLELKAFLSLPLPSPHGLLDEAAALLTPEEQTGLRFAAEKIIQELKQAIRGKDAFFPAQKPVPPSWVQTIKQAITDETPLHIAYQSLGDVKPSHRCIHPLRLDERGPLFYLYAYCTRAEANLTFRLDRISQIHDLP